jgi:hypothetical protein
MKTFYKINLSLILTLLISTITTAQVINDNFDSYTVGQPLASQNSTEWTTWSGTPGSPTEDPLISNSYFYSGSNSVVIKQGNDLVRLHGQLTSGICDIGFKIYIPTGKSGYFNSLNKFVIGDPNANQKWAFECYFNTGSAGSLKAAGSTIPFTYTNDAWQPVLLVVDLDHDSAQLWIDGSKISQWQWTKGYNGAGGYPLQFDATDFFGAASTDEMYIDDFIVTYSINNSLPVELTSFSGSVIGSTVKLIWATATEVNNYGFEILRQAQDDNEWIKIGFVNGNGNSNSPKSYGFDDRSVTSGKYSYRLKQIDNDGQYEYSKEIEVDLGLPDRLELTQNYPNPFNPSTVIKYQLPGSSFVTLKVYDVISNEVATLVNEQKASGNYEVKFDGSKLASGMYIYQLNAGESVITKKMILIK